MQFLEDFWLREPKKQWWEGGVLDAICYGRLCRGLLRIAEDSLKVWKKTRCCAPDLEVSGTLGVVDWSRYPVHTGSGAP